MAIFNPDSPNLASSYGNIISQLESRAGLESKRSRPEDLVSGLVQRIDQELTKERDFEKKMAGTGRTRFTPEMDEAISADLGLPPGTFKRAIGRYYDEDEFQGLIDRARIDKGMKGLEKNIGTQDGLSENEYNALLAGGPEARKALAQKTFSKPTGAKRFERLEIDGISYSIPADVYEAATKSATETGRPWTDFINLQAFGPAGYKRTVFTDPRTGEKADVSGAGVGGARRFTGPQPLDKGQTLRNRVDQLHPTDRKVLDDSSAEVDKDSVVKKLRDSSINLEAVEGLARSGNPAAASILPFRVIRGVGMEVGTLARQDVLAGGGSQALWDRAQRLAKKWTNGELTEDDVNDFVQLARIAKEVNRREMKEVIDRYVSRTMPKFLERNIDPNFVRSAITFEEPTVKRVRNKKTGKVHLVVVDPNGKMIEDLGAFRGN